MSRRRRERGRQSARPPARTPATSRSFPGYAAVFIVAFSVRLAVAIGLSDLALARMPELDSSQYLAWAGWIADGNHAWPQPTIQGPGYPYVLAALMWLAGGSLTTVAILQGALGACSCVITAALGSRWFGSRAGFAAGLLQAVQGPLAFVETSIYCEGLLILLWLLSVYVFATRRTTTAGLVTAGLLLGGAAITRATALVLLPAYLVVLVIESPSWRLGLRRSAVLAAGAACLVVMVAAKNASDPSGSFQLQGFGGLNYYIGNSPAGSGTASFRLGAGWDELWGEASRAGVLTPASQDRYYFRKTFGEIAGDLSGFLRVLAAKTMWSVQADEIRDSLSLYFFAEAVPLLRWLPGFGLLISLAAAGALVLVQRRNAPWELILWIAAAWASVVLLVVGLRYRLPLVPPMAILAGLGASALVDAARALDRFPNRRSLFRRPPARRLPQGSVIGPALRRSQRSGSGTGYVDSENGLVPSASRAAASPGSWRVLVKLGGVAIAAAIVSHLWRHAPSHVLGEEWAMTGSALNAERRLGEAEAAYRRAISLDERSALAWKGLGIVLYNSNRLEEARDAHRRALAIDPQFADAHLRLAFVLGRLGRLHDALAHVRQAAAILPYDVSIRRALGQHLFATGDYRGAIRELEWVLTKTPADEPVSSMLAEARRRSG